MGDHQYEDVWQRVNDTTRDEVLAFWNANGLELPPEQLKERTNQLVFVARDSSGKLVGVCTAYKMKVETLKNYFYAFRCLVDADSRKSDTARDFMLATYKKFDSMTVDGSLDECIGVYIALENPMLRTGGAKARAIWPRTQFVYIGTTASGIPMRIRYFENACIT